MSRRAEREQRYEKPEKFNIECSVEGCDWSLTIVRHRRAESTATEISQMLARAAANHHEEKHR